MRNVVSDADRRAVVDNLLADVGRTLRTEFERPDGIVEASVCRLQSLNRMGATCLEYDKELFLKESVPTGSGVAEAGVVAQAQAAGAQVTGPLSATVGSGVGGDWTVASAAVVPLPGPPPEAQAAAQAEGKALKWPPALLCQAAADGFGADKTQPVAVLPLPVDVEGGALGEERRFVLQWAAENGWSALEPTQVCTPEMVQAALERGALPGYTDGLLDPLALLLGAGNEYRLGLAPGSLLAARTVLTGTVRYNPADIEYYKVELGRGQQPREWITLGDVHRGAVVDGPIEVLDAPSLPSDDYVVRLVLVKKDGNFLQPPYSVPIRISH
jgi:hypothetical protein